MSNDNAPAPLKKFVYPFPRTDASNAAAPRTVEIDDPQVYYDALARAEDGFYPIGYNGQWHGGIHFGTQTGTTLAQDGGVRCIADGEVIAYRIDEQYPTVPYDSCGAARYSTGFALVKHVLQLPEPSNSTDDTNATAAPTGGETGTADAGATQTNATLTFFSLYIHLLHWNDYKSDRRLPRPVYWIAGANKFVVGAKAIDDNPYPAIEAPDGKGINVRKGGRGTARIGWLPQGTALTVEDGQGSWRKIASIDSGTMNPDPSNLASIDAPLGWVFTGELDSAPGEPETKDAVHVFPTPVRIKAGDLVGHLGQYQRYIDMNPLTAACNERSLMQVEVFTTDDIEAFIEQSRERAAQLADRHKTLLLVDKGARLVRAPEGGGSPTGAQLAAQTGNAEDPEAGHPRVIPVKMLGEAVTEEDGTRWWNVEVGTDEGDSAWGWVRERDHANVRLCTPWDWPGFEIVKSDDTRPDQFYANQVVRQGHAAADEQADLAQRGEGAEMGPLFRKLYDLIDLDGDKKIVASEMRRALAKPWLAQAISHLIVRHESEWSGPMDKWNTIDDLIPEQRKKDWEKEKERIESLLWWGEVKGKHHLPDHQPLVAHNIHPIGLIGNFVCNCRCVDVEAFIQNYKARHGEFSNSLGQQLDAASEGHLRVLMEGIVEYYESQKRECFLPHVAYMLATARHETLWAGVYFEPRTEGGSRSYFNKYDPVLASTQAHKDRAVRMENTQEGDGYRYRGRGYVQLTWKVNYRRCGEHLGIDLVNNPDLALAPENASGCMIYGMFSGIFTGSSITRYVNETSKDYFNARRVINGTDKAALIQSYAELFEEILDESKC